MSAIASMKFPRRLTGIVCFVVVALVWLALTVTLASRFNIPSGDGIMYSLPLASARGPFDLGIPFLDDFHGYGSHWGHQWPGGMWLRGALFSLLPYSREADLVVLSLFQLLAATAAAGAVRTATGKLGIAAGVWVLLLSDRLLLLACAGNRLEPLAVAMVVGWFALVFGQHQPLAPGRMWLARVAAFLSPTLHPYSVALGLLIAAFDLVDCRRQGLPVRESVVRAGCFLLGCIATISWFAFQPEALRQFTANAALQKSFYQNWNAVIAGLGSYRLGGGIFLWGSALVTGAALACGAMRLPKSDVRTGAYRFLAPALLLAVIGIHTLLRCENPTYLAFGTPFAAIIIGSFLGGLGSAPSPSNAFAKLARIIPVALAGVILISHLSILPFRVVQFVRAGYPDVRSEFASLLAGLPPDRTVYIPHPMWAAASVEKERRIRWFTFPVASPQAVRKEYEELAYSQAKPGDLLVVDNLGAAGGDRFGLYPTFPLLPPDPARWSPFRAKKHIFPGGAPWGLDVTVYEFIGDH